jgi:hypothetical protein
MSLILVHVLKAPKSTFFRVEEVWILLFPLWFLPFPNSQGIKLHTVTHATYIHYEAGPAGNRPRGETWISKLVTGSNRTILISTGRLDRGKTIAGPRWPVGALTRGAQRKELNNDSKNRALVSKQFSLLHSFQWARGSKNPASTRPSGRNPTQS